jgi:hypothetical protein
LRILPLVPVIREDCPRVVSRQLIELATWFRSVYTIDIMVITSVWDTLISTLFKTDEDGLDLGYSEHYSVAMPAFLAPGAPHTILNSRPTPVTQPLPAWIVWRYKSC